MLPDGRRVKISADSEAQLREQRDTVLLDRQHRKLGLPGLLSTRAPTLVKMIKAYRREHDELAARGGLGAATLDHYYQCTAGVLAWLAEERLEHLRPGELDDRLVKRYASWREGRKLTKKARRPASDVQVRKDLVLLVRVYRWAGEERRWAVPKNLRRHKGGKRILAAPKLFAWLDAMSVGTLERTLAEAAITTSLRPSDLFALELDQVDLEERVFTLVTQKDRKTLIIPFGEELEAHLRAWLKRRQPTLHHRLLFHLEGRPVTSQTLRRRYAAASEAVSIDPPIEYLGGLRNSIAAYLVDAGVPLNHVQLLLGHTDPRTTQGYIKGFTPMKLLRELAGKVERVRGKGE
jgi:site-specific recombinase XerD